MAIHEAPLYCKYLNQGPSSAEILMPCSSSFTACPFPVVPFEDQLSTHCHLKQEKKSSVTAYQCIFHDNTSMVSGLK